MSNKINLPAGSGARFFDVYFLGIGLVIAGHSVFWSLGFTQGFWEFFTSTLVMSVAFFCLCLCLAEMISILPFSGGAYGFSRVTTGPYLGFIVGFFDSVSNIIYVSLTVRTCTTFFQYSFYDVSSGMRYDPLWWAILYIGLFALHMILQNHSFRFISFWGFICVVILIIYILGTAHLQNFKTNVTDLETMLQHEYFEQGTKGFVRLLPISSLMYFGVDMICLVCEDTRDAVRVVPKVILAVMFTLFVLAMALIVCTASQFPTIFYLQGVNIPLSFGFAEIFHTTLNYATISVLPSQFIVMYSLMYVYGRQICALSRSSLLPKVFSLTTKHNSPYVAMLLGMVLGYASLVALKYGTEHFNSTLYKMYYAAQMGSITVYIISMISFIIFRYKYSALERHFTNFAGIGSAVLGIAIFAFTWVALGFLQDDRRFIIKVYAALFGFATVYYFAYARRHQNFSEEEQSVLFTVYVIKANTKRKTLYHKVEKNLRAIMKRVDPERNLFSYSGSVSPKKSRSHNSQNNVTHAGSKIFPVVDSNNSKESKPDVSTVEPMNNSVEYIPDGSSDAELDKKVTFKESKKEAMGTTVTAGLIEMQILPEVTVRAQDDIPRDELISLE